MINNLKSLSWEFYNQYILLSLYEKTIIKKNIFKNNINDDNFKDVDSYIKCLKLIRDQFVRDVLSSYLKLWYKKINKPIISNLKNFYDEIHFYKYKNDTYFINFPNTNMLKNTYNQMYNVKFYFENPIYLIIDYVYWYIDELYSTLHYDISRLTSLIRCKKHDDSSSGVICINIDDEIKNIYHVYDENMYLHWNELKNNKFGMNLIEYNYLYPEYELEEFLVYYPKRHYVKWLMEWDMLL